MKLAATLIGTAVVLTGAYVGAVSVTSSMVDSQIRNVVNDASEYINRYFEPVQIANGDIRPAITVALAHGDSAIFDKKAVFIVKDNRTDKAVTIPLNIKVGALNFTVRAEEVDTKTLEDLGVVQLFEDMHYDLAATKVDSQFHVSLFPYSSELKVNLKSPSTLDIDNAVNEEKYPFELSLNVKSKGNNDIHTSADVRHFLSSDFYIDRMTLNHAYEFVDNDFTKYQSIEPLNIYVDGFYAPEMDFRDVLLENRYMGDIRSYCTRNSQIKNLILKQDILSLKEDNFSVSFNFSADKMFSQRNVSASGKINNIPTSLIAIHDGLDFIHEIMRNKPELVLKNYKADMRYIAERPIPNVSKYAKQKTMVKYDTITVEGSGKAGFDDSLLGLNANFSFEADRAKMEELKKNNFNLQGVMSLCKYFEGKDKKSTLNLVINDNNILVNGKSY
ncbi:Uncharacterised protein [Anaerobiospirillum thomasii]|uniref:hypothetical protein n=1 Tax=Anaerobiospirillum thomasii TaxID=179995 RepID=UPI000D8A4DF9|nr:hypothetical protein [Anaerobiospirillum thomasii]SPT71842.1 Uncharacterised protein [Anaerobiospirillum thomasii]